MIFKRTVVFGMVISFLFLSSSAGAETYWKRGMGIGAASGAVVLGTTMGLAIGLNDCDPGETDLQICGGGWGAAFGVGGAVVGGLLGAGVGALVGSAIKVNETTAIVPVISPDGRDYCLVLRASF